MSAERFFGQRGIAVRRWSVGPISALALFGLSIAGCGLNVSPQSSGQTDSSAPPASSAPVVMTPAPQPGAPMMPMSMPGSSGAPTSGGPGAADDTAQQAAAAAAAMSGQPGGGYGGGPPAGAAAGVDPAQMEAAMRAQQQQQGGGADAAAADPLEMQRKMQEALRGQQNFGGNGPGAGAPSAEEMARQQREAGGINPAAGNALGGAIPGANGEYGGRGGEGGGDFKEDDPEYVITRFANAVLADDYETAGKYVAEKATGLLGSVRKGDISDNQKQQLKAYVTGLKHIGTRPQGRSKTANFNGGSNKVLSFKIEKISDEFVISDLDIHEAPRKRAGR